MSLLPQDRFAKEHEHHEPDRRGLGYNDIRHKFDKDKMMAEPIDKHNGVGDTVIHK